MLIRFSLFLLLLVGCSKLSYDNVQNVILKSDNINSIEPEYYFFHNDERIYVVLDYKIVAEKKLVRSVKYNSPVNLKCIRGRVGDMQHIFVYNID